MAIPFVHLHTHNEFSTLDGIGTAKEWAAQARELGMHSLACTNHGNINGLIRFQKACNDAEIRPILGMEAYIVENAEVKEKGEKSSHVTLLVKNQAGWDNLVRLVSYANMTGFYYKPRIDLSMLCDCHEGLILMSGCAQSYFGKHKTHDYVAKKAFGADFFLEIMPVALEEQIKHNTEMIKWARQNGYPLVATNDCHYPKAEDALLQEVLLAVQTKAKWSDESRFRFTINDLYLKTGAEMVRDLTAIGVPQREAIIAIRATDEIAGRCEFQLSKQNIWLPSPYETQDEDELLWQLCIDGWNQKFGADGFEDNETHDLYSSRLQEEYSLLVSKGFTRYFLIVHELISWCKENNVFTGAGRGSVGGSLIAYLLGITMVDPIYYGLIFSRFIAPDRNDFPDIDLDFEDSKRHLIRQHLEEIYGNDNIASVSTIMKMKARMTIRDVGRVFELPAQDVDVVAKAMDATTKFDEDEEQEMPPEWDEFAEKYPSEADIVSRLSGQIRGVGTHAAAVIVSGEPLTETNKAALVRSKDGLHSINWDMEDSEFMGLMKLDILGLSMLTILHDALDMVNKNHGTTMASLEEIPLDDEEVWDEIKAGRTIGAFQITTQGIRGLCKDLLPSSIFDLSDIIAMYRPGPMQSGMLEKFVKRRKAHASTHVDEFDRIALQNDIYMNITGRTLGLVLYQEQVMSIVHELGGFTWSEADKIRKIMGKKRDVDEFLAFETQFAEGCVDAGHFSDAVARKFFQELSSFAGYSFNMAHSCTYAVIAYWGMWFKTYYSDEFFAASLSSTAEDKKEELISDARRYGIQIVLPKKGISTAEKWWAEDNKIYAPLLEIKGIGEKASEALIVATNTRRGFGDIDKRKVNSKVQRILEEIGYEEKDPISGDQLKAAQQYFAWPVENNIGSAVNEIAHRLRLSQPEKDELIETVAIEDMLAANFEAGRYRALVKSVKDISRRPYSAISKCRDCYLRESCKQPVLPNPSEYNRMIVFEGPSYFDDKQNSFMSGDQGKAVSEFLKTYSYSPKQFHITGFYKCYQGKGNKLDHARAEGKCFKYFEKEVGIVKPFIMCVMGNTAMEYFTGEGKGIKKKNGETEWCSSLGCWVCYCVTPSFFDNQSRSEFKTGIDNFLRKCKGLSIKNKE